MDEVRLATMDDLPDIRNFVDFWLSGRGKTKKPQGLRMTLFYRWHAPKVYYEIQNLADVSR